MASAYACTGCLARTHSALIEMDKKLRKYTFAILVPTNYTWTFPYKLSLNQNHKNIFTKFPFPFLTVRQWLVCNSVAEPEPHHLGIAGTVTRRGSGSKPNVLHKWIIKNVTICNSFLLFLFIFVDKIR
jgi:hypothetical protein